MPSEQPLSLKFLLFLVLFVLLGTSPVLQRLIALAGGLLRKLARQRVKAPEASSHQRPDDLHHVRLNLNDHDILVLRALAMAGEKGLSARGLNGRLHFKPENLQRSLEALFESGLIKGEPRYLFWLRFSLSERGRDYAVAQDYIPHLQR